MGGPYRFFSTNFISIQVFAGIVPDVPGVRPAVTIGTFSSEESEELRRFKKIAQMLNGRYHLVYIINTKSAPTVITIRPFESLEKTIEYVGNFDQRSILTHVTHSSMPSLFDIGNGFTSEIFYPAKQIVLLIFDSILHSELQKEFAIAAGNNAMNNKARDKLFAQIDIQNSVKLDKFMQNLEVKTEQVPILCVFESDSVSCTLKFDANENVEKLIPNSDRLKHKVDIGASSVHPLKYIQSEHINRIFGEQDVKLLPEPRLAKQSSVPMHGHQDPHNLEDMDEGAISGCPMMAHMSHTDRADRDEL
ncbi:thioredoxin-like domain-containing protein [Ditylenchus destructor]|uniref:Thioredoxin-like domain-containing protein n=1 Tax=Ditylenchus destructor TaxID=166010 RepID=A0AAD4QUM4_9BILA|nr:thioredoxin-like domain-containing protein [Ditylenchus destructor]